MKLPGRNRGGISAFRARAIGTHLAVSGMQCRAQWCTTWRQGGTQTRSIRLHTHRRPGSPQYGSDPQWGKCVPTLSAHAPLPWTHACAACKMHVPAHCRRARGLNAGERRLRKIDRRYRRRGRLTSRVICGVQLRESNVPHAAPSDVRTLWRLEAAVEEATRRARYTSVNSLQRPSRLSS